MAVPQAPDASSGPAPEALPPLPPALRRSLFLAGTDTGVGKTHVAVALLQAQRAAGLEPAGMKPVAAGAFPAPAGLRNEDALALAAADGLDLPWADRNPVCLPDPTSPHLAAERVGIQIEMEPIVLAFARIRQQADPVVIEGAGGWFAPVGPPGPGRSRGATMQEVAVALAQPVVLVVGIRLGCLSHALLTADAVRASGLPLAGWIANAVDPHFPDREDYVAALAARLPEPLLWRLGHAS